jgi:hypothetical protein
MKTILGLVALSVTVVGCTEPNNGNGADLAVPADLAGVDLTAPSLCNPVDPMTDGQSCASAACPAGTIGVNQGGTCTCYTKCDPGQHQQCSCNRLCITLTSTNPDGGVIGGGCLPSNTPGERCGVDGNNMPLFNRGICAQNLTCAGPTMGKAYCLYNCGSIADCPAQTQCVQIMDNMGMVIGMACQYVSGAAGVAPGQACTVPGQPCITGHLCDGTCKLQCDGVGATCPGGTTCTKLTDAASTKTTGYVCK